MKHCYKNNLEINGEDHPWSEVTNDQVHKICQLLEKRVAYKDISRIIFGDESKIQIICTIKNGQNWKNISSNYDIPISNSNKQRFSDNELYQLYQLIKLGLKPKEVAIKFGIPIDTYNEKEREKIYRIIRDLRDGKAYMHIKRD